MYRAPLPRTKLLTPYPAARFDGAFRPVTARGRLAGVARHGRPQLGRQHAERWIWLHGLRPGRLARRRHRADQARPVTTPWIATGRSLDGERHRLGGRRARVDAAPSQLRLPAAGQRREGERPRSRPRKNFVGWVYADPDGPEHNTVNCSIADMTLTVSREASRTELRVRAGAAYELGMRENDHGMPIQPFPDG